MSSHDVMPMPSRFASRSLAAAASVLLAVAACTPAATPTNPPGASIEPPSAQPTSPPAATEVPTPVPTFPRNPAAYVEGAPYSQSIDPAMFVAGIDHPFFPMIVGARFVFDGDEHVEVTVMPETKDILGVKATVVRDQVFEAGELLEDTLDYYAQDVDGNVWYFGEDTAEYENGEITTTAGSWVSGVDGAMPGIVMLADPQVGDTYRQEFYAGEAEDIGMVTALSGSVTTPAGSWSGADVLVTEEWSPLEPGVREQKTYARGVGVVETRVLEGGQEVTHLTSVTFPTGATPGWPSAAISLSLALLLVRRG